MRKPFRETDLIETVSRAMGVTLVEAPSPDADAGASGDARTVGLEQLLRDVNPRLLADLREACRQARPTGAMQLADDGAAHSLPAADAIRQLASDFRYQALLDAIDAAERGGVG